MLKWIFYVRPKNPPKDSISLEGLEDIPFAKAIRNRLVRGSSISLLYRPGLTVGEAIPTEGLINYNVEDGMSKQ